MHRIDCRLAFALMLLSTTSLATAATLHVPADHLTIQGCIDAAISGQDECVVAPGTYVEAINFNGKAITLRSSGGLAVTTIDGNGAFHVVQCISGEGPGTILDGFTITGGIAEGVGNNGYGGGMYNVDSSPTVTNCAFLGNMARFDGGGIHNLGSSPTVTNCTFSGNSGRNGGGMSNQTTSDPTVTNCAFTGNSALSHGGGLYNSLSAPAVTNCSFSGNSAPLGGGGVSNSTASPTFANCTFSGNAATFNGGGMYNRASSALLTNCILWGDSPDEMFNSDPIVETPTISYSIVQGGVDFGTTDAGNNIDADPLFIDADGADNALGTVDDDLRLRACSPAIDSADNTAIEVSAITDLSGAPRFSDDTGVPDTGNGTSPIVDIGAFEYQVTTPPGMIENVTQSTFHCSIQSSIDAAESGDEIVIPPGAYFESIKFRGRPVTVRSSSGAAVTTINGKGALHVVLFVSGEGSGTVLEGFTITGGAAKGSRFGFDRHGAGMLIERANPTVTNCIFSRNVAEHDGGGMLNARSSPTVTNCIFIGNKARSGGGIFNVNQSAPAITNCVFNGNTASSLGGGLTNQTTSSPTIANCTFSRNTASDGGGIYNTDWSRPTLTHCTMWNDIPNEIVNDDPIVDTPTVGFSDVGESFSAGTIDGGGNIDADPMFVRVPDDGGDGWGDDPETSDVDEGANDDYGDLRLQVGSPCINTGSAALLPTDEADIDGDGDLFEPLPLDLDGHARVLCGEVDMGAFEFGIGDYDCNGTVDLTDFSHWATCMIEPGGGSYPDGCEALDFDGDGVITLRDFAGFQGVISGE